MQKGYEDMYKNIILYMGVVRNLFKRGPNGTENRKHRLSEQDNQKKFLTFQKQLWKLLKAL